MGKSSDYILRHSGDPSDASLSLEHRRHHGHILQIFVLESVLLLMHEETEEETLETWQRSHDS